MGFVRPWKRCGCLSFCLHLVSPNIQCLALRWSEICRCGSGHFQGNSSLTAAHICFTGFPAEGKQMRRNVNSRLLMQHCAKIWAPAARTELQTHSPLYPARRASSRQTEELAASVQHRRQRHNPTCPHPLLVHVTAALLSPNVERSAYALSVLVQVDLLLPRRHWSGYWMWYRKNSSWVPACCLLRLRCRALCSTFRGKCL